MINFQETVKNNPISLFIWVLIGIFVFLVICIILALFISFNPTINVVSSFFNTTNISTTQNFFNNQINVSQDEVNTSINNSILDSTGFNLISPIIALLGSFGVFAYLFYSIKEGTLSKTENRKLLYGFLGGMGIIILLIAIVFTSFFQGKYPYEKYIEILGLIALFLFMAIIAYFFKLTFDAIEENYTNRQALIDFLEIKISKAIIWQPIDNFARCIVALQDFFSYFVFVLICLIPIVGILLGLNLLSIIFIEIMIFTLFSGFCRLISLCENTSNITLKKRICSEHISFSSKRLSNIFFLPSPEEGYFKILTKNGYVTILKNEILTIHDNEVIIFKGKEKLLPLNIWIKRSVRFVLSLILAGFLYLLFFFGIVGIAILVRPNDLLQILQTTMPGLLLTIEGNSLIFAFCIIGWFCQEIDEYLKTVVDQFMIVPHALEFY
ncbi:MAG: hypothetical protein ABFC71_09320 [Methanoregula sp.]